MELRESADGLRWAIGRARAMAVIWVQIAKTASRAVERTEPDVHLIKQVEQVTMSALEGPVWRFARIPSAGVTNAVEILAFLIWQLPHWLLFGCKNSQKRPGDCLRRGSPAMLPALTGGSTHRAPSEFARSLLLRLGRGQIRRV
jgi:hypothetical protein